MKAVEAWIWPMNSRENALHITEEVRENGDTIGHDVSLGAIASLRELLGYSDPLECLEAIIQVAKEGRSDKDPVTGKHVFTDVYTLLAEREKAREDAAESTVSHGLDQGRVVEVSNKAAYQSVHVPINGGDCLLDRCRDEARANLGLPRPSTSCREETRTSPIVLPQQMRTMSSGIAVDDAAVIEVLHGREQEILTHTQRFLHGLSGHSKDLVTPEPTETTPPEMEPELGEPILTADQIRAKYQEAH